MNIIFEDMDAQNANINVKKEINLKT